MAVHRPSTENRAWSYRANGEITIAFCHVVVLGCMVRVPMSSADVNCALAVLPDASDATRHAVTASDRVAVDGISLDMLRSPAVRRATSEATRACVCGVAVSDFDCRTRDTQWLVTYSESRRDESCCSSSTAVEIGRASCRERD